MELFYCDVCGKKLTDGDVERGDAVQFGTAVFCKKCNPALAEQAAQKPQPKRATSRKLITAARPATKHLPQVTAEPARNPQVMGMIVVLSILLVCGIGAFLFLQATGGSSVVHDTTFEDFKKHEARIRKETPKPVPDVEKPVEPARVEKPPETVAQTPDVAARVEPAPTDSPVSTPATPEKPPADVTFVPDALVENSAAVRGAYLKAREQFAEHLKQRDYTRAGNVIEELLADPAPGPVKDLLQADAADMRLLMEFMDAVLENAQTLIGKNTKICGAPSKIDDVAEGNIKFTTRGAKLSQPLTRLYGEELLEFYNAAPHARPEKAIACRAAFYLAENKLKEAQFIAGNVQLEEAYAKAYRKRLELVGGTELGAPGAAASTTPVKTGRLVSATGQVVILRGSARTQAAPGAEIMSTDRVETGDATAVFEYTNGPQVVINTGSAVSFDVVNGRPRVVVHTGEVYCDSEKPPEVITPDGQVTEPGASSGATGGTRTRPQTVPETTEEAWTPLFNGKDLAAWQIRNATETRIEDGAIVCKGLFDMYYGAAWSDFEFACDVKVDGRGDAEGGLVGFALNIPAGGSRDSGRFKLIFYNDGDVHLYKDPMGTIWKSGAGKASLTDRTPLRFSVLTDALKIWKADQLLGTVDISKFPPVKGGISLFTNSADITMRLWNPRVKILGQSARADNGTAGRGEKVVFAEDFETGANGWAGGDRITDNVPAGSKFAYKARPETKSEWFARTVNAAFYGFPKPRPDYLFTVAPGQVVVFDYFVTNAGGDEPLQVKFTGTGRSSNPRATITSPVLARWATARVSLDAFDKNFPVSTGDRVKEIQVRAGPPAADVTLIVDNFRIIEQQ